MSEQSNRTSTEKARVELPLAFRVNGDGLPDGVFKLRKKLYIKAKREPKFRFYTLYDRIYRRDVLAAAWDSVAGHGGAPGVDGLTIEAIGSCPGGVEAYLDELHEVLKNRRYKPQAVKRVWIPKSSGGRRPLGIPTIRDRVVQTAAKLVLEAIFEADFLDVSYGFRPRRSAQEALEAVHTVLKTGRHAVYDADLKGYFDSIPHDKLMACVEMRVADRTVLKLIRMWLTAWVREEPDEPGQGSRKVKQSAGTPQGGVISPLLANLYLHWLDKRFHGADGPARFASARLVRYADDFVILARYQGVRLRDWVEATVEGWMGLELNRDKTRVFTLKPAGESLDFLGYTFRLEASRFHGAPPYVNWYPSAKACAREREVLRSRINARQCFTPLPELIDRLNRHLRGWGAYFDHGYARRARRAMNWYILQRLTAHLQRRSQRPYRPPAGVSWYRHFYEQLGLVKL